ncbi:RING-type domain-containing protein [Mycena indigotica]|uniref:RING-type domain-containing protein n=1 Tax=Mycena indigotica TaxID=2126181 RepID=A0A8H6S9K9_9AGAR|nr:RING-type domain-containing protein [Mycena indigotica]KAF7295369.1 RING-type domain-containing protein [Mycena indigotica]
MPLRLLDFPRRFAAVKQQFPSGQMLLSSKDSVLKKKPKKPFVHWLPVLLNLATNGVTPNWTVKEAKEMGFKLVIFPCSGMIPAALAIRKAYQEIKTQGSDVEGCGGLGPKGVFEIVGLNEIMDVDAGSFSLES